MYRFVARLTIFAFIMSLSLYIGAQWKVSEDLDYIKEQLAPIAQFEYESSFINLKGQVVIGGINFYIPSNDINISINRMMVSTGSIFKMVFLRREFNDNFVSKNFSYSLDDVVIPLTPSLVKFITDNEEISLWNVLDASACGNVKKIGFKEYFSMGYDYLVFSTEGEFTQDSYSGNMLGNGWFDIEETTRLDYRFNIAHVYENLDEEYVDSPAPSIEELSLRLEDKGYNRRKAEYCSIKSEVSSEEFIEQHIKTISDYLKSVNIKLMPSGRRIYQQYIQPSSVVEVTIQPQTSFSFKGFGYYDEQELRELMGLDFKVNGQTSQRIFEGWSLDKFNQIIVKKDSQSGNSANKRFEIITIKRRYEQEPLDRADRFIDQQVKIVRDDGVEYIGMLRRTEPNKIYIDKSIEGGIVQLGIERRQVAGFYVYRQF